ncbi:molybdopterin molybdotransferase MoeA [Jannaschia sp. Os4]|uniref:molybdopterin molybdotransferase MoeA n=1 Tax=Jannaschia sp. Os4 TaxID=2807617 RepID=UPI00193A33AB|nr:molybdopterin molybdotransferase MoeA [Jannaschia sp. Os4]MBM2577014.1 molybdopterin molybdotransferase MoeA [Jannaschia sp. Os4]
MISVEAATERLLSLVSPLPSEPVPLRRAAGRVLAAPVVAAHPMPPFDASAMDGYAVAGDARPGASFEVIGEAAAGSPFAGRVGPGRAVRIFTGAVLPPGTDRVVIQEDVTRDGARITVGPAPEASRYVRPAGMDFEAGFTLAPPRALGARDVALLAAMGAAEVEVARRPAVALVMSGDELRPPGAPLAPGEIPASNGPALAAMLAAAGATCHQLPTARDTPESLAQAFALAASTDLVITLGGASVGDHDLVADAARTAGFDLRFETVAMRPGKPVMAGPSASQVMVGLPGNPVSTMVCGVVFILPMLRRMQGLDPVVAPEPLPLAAPLPANGPRRHYMRATTGPDGVTAFARQDSNLLRDLAFADRLVVRPPHAPPAAPGEVVETIPLPG